jgi:hypothetical protein
MGRNSGLPQQEDTGPLQPSPHWGGRMDQQGLTLVATTTSPRYLRIKSYLKKLDLSIYNPGIVLRVLQWQQEVNGETGKIIAFNAVWS